jgi:HEAT repeat protein
VALEILSRGLAEEDTREPSARGLVAAGELARPRLRQLASDSEDDVTIALAAEALVKLGDRRMVDWLEERLAHEEPPVRAAAVRVLGATSDDEGFFVEHLNDHDSRVRAAAVTSLARRQNVDWAADLLSEASIRDPAPAIRGSALRILARIDASQLLLDTARAALDQPENPTTVRIAAIQALAHVDDINSAELLLLDVLGNGEPTEQLRAAAVLASYGNDMGHEYLRRALNDPNVATAGGAAVAASSIGGPLEDLLVQALSRREPEIRFQVAASLLQLGDHDEALTVLAQLAERPGWLGLQAAIALARVQRDMSRAALRLAAALEDDSADLRAFAALSCGFVDSGWEIAAAGLGDEEATVQIAAATSVLRGLQRM